MSSHQPVDPSSSRERPTDPALRPTGSEPSPTTGRPPSADTDGPASSGPSAATPSGEPSAPTHEAPGSELRPTPLTQQIGRGVVIALAALFGVFAVANSQRVSFSWIFGETSVVTDATGVPVSGGVPLIVLLVASLLIGVLVGVTIMWQRARTRRRRSDVTGSSRRGDPT